MNTLAYCAEDGSSVVHIVTGTRGVAKPTCGPWWEEPTRFHRIAADRPTCRICLRILGESVGAPRIRLKAVQTNSRKPLVHLSHHGADGSHTPRCGARMVVTKDYATTSDPVTCSHCLGIARKPGVRA